MTMLSSRCLDNTSIEASFLEFPVVPSTNLVPWYSTPLESSRDSRQSRILDPTPRVASIPYRTIEESAPTVYRELEEWVNRKSSQLQEVYGIQGGITKTANEEFDVNFEYGESCVNLAAQFVSPQAGHQIVRNACGRAEATVRTRTGPNAWPHATIDSPVGSFEAFVRSLAYQPREPSGGH